MKTHFFFIIIGFLLFIDAAHSQDTLFSIENKSLKELMNTKISVSSSWAEKVFSTPSTVTVIDRNLIAQYNFLTVSDALRTVAGINVLYSNLEQTIPTSRGILQNYYPNKILLLINSIPTWQPIFGNGDFDRIDINDIERIEVLKGPASVLYGSNAFTAVVNIILRSGTKQNVNCTIRSGIPQLGSAGANITFSNGLTNFFISANSSYEIRKPYEVQSKHEEPYKGDSTYYFTQEQRFHNFNISVNRLEHTLFVNTFAYTYNFLGVTPSYISAGGNPLYNQGILLNYKFEKEFSDKISVLSNIGYDYYKRNHPDNYTRETQLVFSTNRIFANIKAQININENLKFEVGLDGDNRHADGHQIVNVLKDTLVRQNLKNSADILEWSAFAQAQLKIADFSLLWGTRLTRNPNFGSNWSHRLSMVYHFLPSSSIKFIFGQAFRTPSMLELYFDHPTVIGNRSLEPELHSSTELAYLLGLKKFFIQVTGFISKFDHLIQRVTPATGPPSEYKNLGEFEGIGSEIEIKYINSASFSAFLSYSFTKGIGDDAKSNYNFVPDHLVSCGIHKIYRQFFVSTYSFFMTRVDGIHHSISSQFYADINTGIKHVVKDRINLQHTLSIKNILKSEMLVPEYIRQTKNINELATMGYGMRLVYSLSIKF